MNAATGATIGAETRRSPSVIVYTPAGFVGVHFPPLNRKPFAADAPTPEEAQAALRGYIGYYGALTVYPGQVFHNILGGVSPVGGSILRRSAVINGDELTVQLPRTRNQQGDEAQTVVILKRLSGAADMPERRSRRTGVSAGGPQGHDRDERSDGQDGGGNQRHETLHQNPANVQLPVDAVGEIGRSREETTLIHLDCGQPLPLERKGTCDVPGRGRCDGCGFWRASDAMKVTVPALMPIATVTFDRLSAIPA